MLARKPKQSLTVKLLILRNHNRRTFKLPSTAFNKSNRETNINTYHDHKIQNFKDHPQTQ